MFKAIDCNNKEFITPYLEHAACFQVHKYLKDNGRKVLRRDNLSIFKAMNNINNFNFVQMTHAINFFRTLDELLQPEGLPFK